MLLRSIFKHVPFELVSVELLFHSQVPNYCVKVNLTKKYISLNLTTLMRRETFNVWPVRKFQFICGVFSVKKLLKSRAFCAVQIIIFAF